MAAVLDANVLYSARLRDLFLRLAIAGQYRALWTERILDECFNNLSADRPDIPAEYLRRTRRLMAVAVPDAVVQSYEHLIDELDLPDADDRHVLAAAVAAGADLMVTANLDDFPPAAIPPGIAVLGPDDFVLRLIEDDVDAVRAVVDQQAAALQSPPMTTEELLEGLAMVGLRKSVSALRSATP
jgi:predicted nucleic acid-binding protein